MTHPAEHRRQEIADKAIALTARHPGSLMSLPLLKMVAGDEGVELLEADLRDMAGILRHEGGRWRIYLNRQDSPARQRFTLAHVLGHFFLHARPGRAFVKSGFVTDGTTVSPVEEREAGAFAASLLMPEGVIEETLLGGEPTEPQVMALARRFGVSPLAAAIRMRALGHRVPVIAPTGGEVSVG